jgi:hypothetical protein
MIVFLDTSVLVAGLVEAHPHFQSGTFLAGGSEGDRWSIGGTLITKGSRVLVRAR